MNEKRQVKEYVVKFEDGTIETFNEGILLGGEFVKKNNEIIGFGVSSLSRIQNKNLEYYYEGTKVLLDTLKEQLENLQQRKDELKEKLVDDMFEDLKIEMAQELEELGIEMDDRTEEFCKKRIRKFVDAKMEINKLKDIGIDIFDILGM